MCKKKANFILDVPGSCRENLLDIVRDVFIRDIMYGFIASQR